MVSPKDGEENPGVGRDTVSVFFIMGVWSFLLRRTITWKVENSPDPWGDSFPGPGVFGVDTQKVAHIEGHEVKSTGGDS